MLHNLFTLCFSSPPTPPAITSSLLTATAQAITSPPRSSITPLPLSALSLTAWNIKQKDDGEAGKLILTLAQDEGEEDDYEEWKLIAKPVQKDESEDDDSEDWEFIFKPAQEDDSEDDNGYGEFMSIPAPKDESDDDYGYWELISKPAQKNASEDDNDNWTLIPTLEQEDDDEDWEVISPLKQKSPQELKGGQKKLINDLRRMPGYYAQFTDPFKMLEKLVDNEDREICPPIRLNRGIQKRLLQPEFYPYPKGRAENSQWTATLPSKIDLVYAKAVQERLFLETAALYECQPFTSLYQTLIQQRKYAQHWKRINTFINTYLEAQKITPEQAYLLRVSIWYHAWRHLTFPFPIEQPDHLADIPPKVLDQALNQAKKPIDTPLTLSQQLYTLPFWANYILTRYQSDPTVRGSPLEQACKEISQMRQERVCLHPLPKTRPLLKQEFATEK